MDVFTGFILFTLAVLALILAVRAYSKAKNTHLELSAHIRRLEERLEKLYHAYRPPTPSPEQELKLHSQAKPPIHQPTPHPVPHITPPPTLAPLTNRAKTPITVPGLTSQTPQSMSISGTVPPTRPRPEWFQKLEKRFMENWIGILGSIVLVVGLSILGLYLYTLIPDSALLRFGLLVAASGLLFVCFFILQKKVYWKELALWLRSSAAAVFLFACFAAGGIPGLQWINDPLPALMLLCVGIIANLFLAYIGGRETFASLHVLLSLISISIAPQAEVTFVIAAIITLFGVILTYREKWEYHLFLTITCFFVYIIYWYFQVSPVTASHKILAFTGILIIYGLAAFTHYKKIYHTLRFNPKSFLVHLANWCFLGAGLYLYSPRLNSATIFIGLAASGVFFLARQAKKHNVRWLYITDTVMAQVIAYIAILSLSMWQVKWVPILSILYLETLLFCGIMLLEKEEKLLRWGTCFHSLLNLSLAGLAFIFIKPAETAVIYTNSFALLVSAVATQVYNLVTEKKFAGLFKNDNNYIYNLVEKRKTNLLVLIGMSGLSGVTLAFSLCFYNGILINLPAYLILLTGAFGLLASRGRFQKKYHYYMDILLAQGMAFFLIFALAKWQIPFIYSLGMAIIESALFALLHFKKEKMELNLLGIGLINLGLVSMIFIVWTGFSAFTPVNLLFYQVLIFSFLLAGFLYLIYLNYKVKHACEKELIKTTLTPLYNLNKDVLGGIIIGLLATFFLLINLAYHKYNWSSFPLLAYFGPFYYILPFVVALLYYRQRYQTRGLTLNGLGFSLYAFILGLHIYCWFSLTVQDLPSLELTGIELTVNTLLHSFIHYLPLLLMSLASIKMSYWEKTKSRIKWFGIYLFMLQLSLLIYFCLNPISSFIPGPGWLLLSLITLEIANIYVRRAGENPAKNGKADFHYMFCGYLLIIAFLIRHLMVHLQTEQYPGLVNVRLLIEIFALVVFIYWFIRTNLSPGRNRESPASSAGIPASGGLAKLHPLLLELIILFSSFMVLTEVNPQFHPLIWICGAGTFLLVSKIQQLDLSRLQLYSIFLFLASIIHVAFLSSPYAADHYRTFDWQWILAGLAILMQAVYIVLFYRLYKAETIKLPFTGRFSEMMIKVDKRKNLWIFYPMLISITLFLIWSFDKSILTLLLTGEAFLIFIISLILRENHFRYLSMLGLLACIIRLVGYDLAKAHTIAKALVCIGMAIIMLLMNALYNRFKKRYESEK